MGVHIGSAPRGVHIESAQQECTSGMHILVCISGVGIGSAPRDIHIWLYFSGMCIGSAPQ